MMLLLLSKALALEPMVGLSVGVNTGRVDKEPHRVFVGLDFSLGVLKVWDIEQPYLQLGPMVEGRVSLSGRPSLDIGAMS